MPPNLAWNFREKNSQMEFTCVKDKKKQNTNVQKWDDKLWRQ